MVQLEDMKAMVEQYQKNNAAAEAALRSSQSEVETLQVSSLLLSHHLPSAAPHLEKETPPSPTHQPSPTLLSPSTSRMHDSAYTLQHCSAIPFPHGY